MNRLVYIFALVISFTAFGQKSYHVDAKKGTSTASGTVDNPWDLQTALSSKPVQPGDTIYLHKGDSY